MYVVATAGHVDHGKSTLVRALTGMEPDRWAEERRRGMTIDLGFAWTGLPSGAHIAFVDVPGHERFMSNMLAGVGPVPAVMFVVAADEGWRAQSGEHLAALDTFGVRHGLLAVTRADLADPGPVTADALARIGATSIGRVAAVAVDSVRGTGVPELRAALDRLVSRLPAADVDADVRLWVDRAFTITGLGTVVTGTLGAGTLREDDELELSPYGRKVRVRGLESMKRSHQAVPAVARVAVNLRGVGRTEVRRGDVLVTPERWWSTKVFDARVHSDFLAAEITLDMVLHIGSAAVPVRLRALGEGHLRVSCARALPLRIGDVALLRDPAQQLIVARLTVVDVDPPALSRRYPAVRRAAELSDYATTADGPAEVRRRRLVRATALRAMGGADPQVTPVIGDWLVDREWWRQQQDRLAELVAEYATANPTDPGLPMEQARRALRLPDRQLVRALCEPPLHHSGGRLFGAQTGPTLPEPVLRALGQIRADLEREPFLAPMADRLTELALDHGSLTAAVRAGVLLQVADGVYLLPGADLSAVHRLAELPEPFTVSEARQVLDTTRRVAVPLLELLDRKGWTERLDDARRRIRSIPTDPTDPTRSSTQ
ncbi:MAG TPA: selenocysteine-specific translation elongation factor [Micromonosporaceae bacterium]|jgi:selenocysteine-specific elongation factor|nr:selenocysteine-specific translation elongation factor [Micromonosporaceae bacterium]